jgi:hypothetical protein
MRQTCQAVMIAMILRLSTMMRRSAQSVSQWCPLFQWKVEAVIVSGQLCG